MSVNITFFRSNGDAILTVKPDTSSNLQKAIMGDYLASINFEVNAMYNFRIEDYADILGERYYISKPPLIVKTSKFNYSYTIIMEPDRYRLRNAQFLFYNSFNVLASPDFSLTGTADDFMNLIVANMKRVSLTWAKGGVITTGYRTLTFSNESCIDALQRVAKEFETEFYIDGTTIHLAKHQKATAFAFMYGRTLGLYSITRELIDQPIVTRLYAYGSDKNLPVGYRNGGKRLQIGNDPRMITDLIATRNAIGSEYYFSFTAPLDPTVTDLHIAYRPVGSTGAAFTAADIRNISIQPRFFSIPPGEYEWLFASIIPATPDAIFVPSVVFPIPASGAYLQNISYIEQNVGIYGLIESSFIDDNIYPKRVGTITATNLLNPYKFRDTTLDFDVNTHLLPGIVAKISFNTGQLAGYTFDISTYSNTDKEFTILKNKEEKALDVPSLLIRAAIGDSYTLFDIQMPPSYIAKAETELRNKAAATLLLASSPQYTYRVDCDPAHFRAQNIELNVGDIVRIIDNELQVDKPIRITRISRALEDEFQYAIDLGDSLSESAFSNLKSLVASTSSGLTNTTNQVLQSAIFNGTWVGNFHIEQGTLFIDQIPVGGTGGVPLYIEPSGRVYK